MEHYAGIVLHWNTRACGAWISQGLQPFRTATRLGAEDGLSDPLPCDDLI